ncbi:hypothetical protein EVAR_26522_1 [Eumeta japonica]|uniref:Uncharacterized protein n=1 Tax=Eumeta variegata TaxID=151549 RepID=A0A4C1V7T9_EUMVA|nr:hypothetical protein EVAR_26522_1 [Eumeta japonica]
MQYQEKSTSRGHTHPSTDRARRLCNDMLPDTTKHKEQPFSTSGPHIPLRRLRTRSSSSSWRNRWKGERRRRNRSELSLEALTASRDATAPSSTIDPLMGPSSRPLTQLPPQGIIERVQIIRILRGLRLKSSKLSQYRLGAVDDYGTDNIWD